MNNLKIGKAVALALAGAALTAGGISNANATATTMYNTFTTTAPSDTDGWVWGGIGKTSVNNGTGLATPGFVGIGGSSSVSGQTPFGYTGSAHLNWAAEVQTSGSFVISRADSQARYGFSAEIDTGAGAWQDAGNLSATPPVQPTGWKHQTDIGIIMTDHDMTLTLNLTRIGTPSSPGLINDNFGITIFTGMDTNTGAYSHHGGWNCPTCTTPRPYDASDPFGTTGVTFLTYDPTVDQTNGLTFKAKAGEIYSVYLGGAGVGQWAQNVSDYALNVKAAPEPATLSLFGVALAGMGATRRRKA